MSGDNALVEARKLTSALRRVRHSMEGSLGQAHEAMSTLSSDGEIITETHDEHKIELKGALSTAGRRLNKVMRLELLEKYSVALSLAFFFLVVAFIVIRRTRVLVLLYRLMSHLFTLYVFNPETDNTMFDAARKLINDRSSSVVDTDLANLINTIVVENIENVTGIVDEL